MTFFLAICLAPFDKLTANIAGNNSGVSPTAIASAKQ